MTKGTQCRMLYPMKLHHTIVVLSFIGALYCVAADSSFEPYKIILDKNPFGEAPLESESTPLPATQSFAQNLRLSMLYEGPGGDIRAGLIDSQNNKSYILAIGESEDELELIEADLKTSEAMIRKGAQLALFRLKEAPSWVLQEHQPKKKNSYATPRKELISAPKEKNDGEEPEQQIATGNALKKHLEAIQMDAIRTGKEPLPIPLTPEMDAQLVAEGVLAPQ